MGPIDVDAKLVYCKECKLFVKNKEAHVTYCKRELKNLYAVENGFCSYGIRKDSKMATENNYFGKTGWICPVCGRGLSPYTSFCPCKKDKEQVLNTIPTENDFSLDKYMKRMNTEDIEELERKLCKIEPAKYPTAIDVDKIEE